MHFPSARPTLRLIDCGAVAVPHTGDTLEATLAQCTIPAGLLGLNGQVIVETFWSYTNNSNNKTARVRFGGSTVQQVTTTTTASNQLRARVANRGAANSQVCQPAGVSGTGTSTSAPTTTAIDTSADVTLTITGQCANAADTMTLESWAVYVLLKP